MDGPARRRWWAPLDTSGPFLGDSSAPAQVQVVLRPVLGIAATGHRECSETRSVNRHLEAEASAVPAFATYNLEMVQAVVAAAEQTSRPVIILAGSSHVNHAGRSALISIALQAAADSTATIGVHLDHCRDLAEIEQCVQAGYSSVMVDGSHLPFEDNVELTRAAVAVAHPAGAWVEAELGAVPGDEDVSIDAARRKP